MPQTALAMPSEIGSIEQNVVKFNVVGLYYTVDGID